VIAIGAEHDQPLANLPPDTRGQGRTIKFAAAHLISPSSSESASHSASATSIANAPAPILPERISGPPIAPADRHWKALCEVARQSARRQIRRSPRSASIARRWIVFFCAAPTHETSGVEALIRKLVLRAPTRSARIEASRRPGSIIAEIARNPAPSFRAALNSQPAIRRTRLESSPAPRKKFSPRPKIFVTACDNRPQNRAACR